MTLVFRYEANNVRYYVLGIEDMKKQEGTTLYVDMQHVMDFSQPLYETVVREYYRYGRAKKKNKREKKKKERKKENERKKERRERRREERRENNKNKKNMKNKNKS